MDILNADELGIRHNFISWYIIRKNVLPCV